MKAVIIPVEECFKPVKVEISIESADELSTLYYLSRAQVCPDFSALTREIEYLLDVREIKVDKK